MGSSQFVEYYRLPHQPITVLKIEKIALKSVHCAVSMTTIISVKSNVSGPIASAAMALVKSGSR